MKKTYEKHVSDLIKEEDNESESVFAPHKQKCPIHNQSIKLICIPCSKDLCLKCLIQHNLEYAYHHLREYSFLKRNSNIKKDIKPFELSLKNCLKEEFQDQGLKIIFETKDKTINYIHEYFNNLLFQYQNNDKNNENNKNIEFMLDSRRNSNNLKQILLDENNFFNINKALNKIIYIKENDNENKIIESENENFNIKFIKNQNYQSKKLHSIIPHLSSIIILDIESKNFLYSKIKGLNIEIPIYHSSHIIKNDILMFGGFFKTNEKFNEETYIINLETFEIKNLESKIQIPIIANGIVLIDKYIYSIGGKTNNLIRTNECQKYNIINRKWEKMSNMKYIRSSPSICNWNNLEIYVFFGIDNFKQTNKTIEKYFCQSDKWIEIEYNFNLNIIGIHQSSCFQINNEEIIIFGGYLMEDNLIANQEIYIYNVSNNYFNKNKNKIYKTGFIGCSQACNSLINDNKEILTLRFMNKEFGKEINEFPDIFILLSLNEKKIKVENVINCSNFSKR